MAKTLLKYFRGAKGVAHKAMRKSNQKFIESSLLCGRTTNYSKMLTITKDSNSTVYVIAARLKNP